MHRCLSPHSLPARARCVPNLLTLNRPPLPLIPWRRTLPLRCYSAVVEEQRVNEPSHKGDALSTVSSGETDGSAQWVWKQEPKLEEDNADSLGFTLKGYDKQPIRKVRAVTRRGRIWQAFDSSHAHLDNRRPRSPTTQKHRSAPRQSAGQQSKHPMGLLRSEELEYALKKQPVTRYLRPWCRRAKVISTASMGQSSIPAPSRVWKHNFAKAQSLFDKRQRNSIVLNDAPLLTPHAANWVDIVTTRIAEKQDPDINGLAKSSDWTDPNMVWAHIALWLLHYDQNGLVEFLLATSSSSPLPWVLDCLQVLAAHYAQMANKDTILHFGKLHEIFCANAENVKEQKVAFDGRFIRRMAPYSTPTQMSGLYRAMRLADIEIHHYDWLYIAWYFAKNDHCHQALEALLEAHRAGAPIEGNSFLSVCATLLRGSMKQPDGLRVCLHIFDNLVGIGVTPNTQLCNILMLNAAEAGDIKTALGVYQSMVDNDVVADKYTNAIMLKCCKLDIDNAELLNQTITRAIEGLNISQNPVIATEILHCLALHHTRNNKENAWTIICQAFAQIFELSPLERLGLPIPQSVKATPRAKEPMIASKFEIGIMLHAYVQLVIDGHGSTARAQDMYKLYHALIESRTEPFASTAMSTHCYNAFLIASIQDKRTLINAAQIIKDMQNLSAESPPKAVAPDVYSWSIFLHGFTLHGQLKLAEQVLSYMRDKGIEPNAVTLNTLLLGYSTRQDFKGVEHTLRELDAGEQVWDKWTYNGLGRLRNSRKLRALLAEKGRPAELDFTEDLKEDLGARFNKEIS